MQIRSVNCYLHSSSSLCLAAISEAKKECPEAYNILLRAAMMSLMPSLPIQRGVDDRREVAVVQTMVYTAVVEELIDDTY